MSRRRYGARHQSVRAALLPAAYGQPCPHCGETMWPGQALDLDHVPGTALYRGMAHAVCNRREGGRRGRAKQLARRGGVF